MRVITLNSNKKVIGTIVTNEDYVLGEADIVSDTGDIGQIQQADGTFIDDDSPNIPVMQPITLEELQQNQLTLMDVLATMYEAMLAKGTV